MKIFEKLEKIIKKEIPVCINEKNDIAHRIRIKQVIGEETANEHHFGYEYFCFDCDVEPTFCPIENLIEKFGGRCQWKSK